MALAVAACGCTAPAPPAASAMPQGDLGSSDARPVSLRAPEPARPEIAADGARCRGSKAKLDACAEECRKRDEVACGALVEVCEEGDGIACSYAASYLESRAGSSNGDPVRLVRYLDVACVGGMLSACVRLAGLFTHGQVGVLADEARARDAERRAAALTRTQCEQKDPHGCMALGSFSEHGWGMNEDAAVSRRAYARGFKLMNEACRKREGLMCHMLAVYHLEGTGTPVDRVKARRFLERACSLQGEGAASSCLMLEQVFGARSSRGAGPFQQGRPTRAATTPPHERREETSARRAIALTRLSSRELSACRRRRRPSCATSAR